MGSPFEAAITKARVSLNNGAGAAMSVPRVTRERLYTKGASSNSLKKEPASLRIISAAAMSQSREFGAAITRSCRPAATSARRKASDGALGARTKLYAVL